MNIIRLCNGADKFSGNIFIINRSFVRLDIQICPINVLVCVIDFEKLGDDGKPQFVNMPLGRLGPGDCFGFRAAAGDTYGARTRHNVTIVSTSPVIVHSLTRYDIFNRIDPMAKAELRRWSSTYEDDILLSRQMENYENLNKIKHLYRKELFPPKYIHRMEKKSKDVVEMVNELA